MSTSLERARQLSWAIAVRQSDDFFQARIHARHLLQGSKATRDPQVLDHLDRIFQDDLLHDGLYRSQCLVQFTDQAHDWLLAHRYNRLSGLHGFRRHWSAGTTQSFDSFYLRHRLRRMRCFVGEYFYHIKTWISTGMPWGFVTDQDPLAAGDAIIISLPFCDTGARLPDFDHVLTTCDQLKIPVLIDCCYHTISGGINADLDRDCVDTVCFSLSKAFPVANLRIGVRYVKPHIQDGQGLLHDINYNNSLSAHVGMRLMDRFGSDWIYDNYLARQQEVCQWLNLNPSPAVLFALGDDNWTDYSRANLLRAYQLQFDPALFRNRISLVEIFDNWDIFSSLQNEPAS